MYREVSVNMNLETVLESMGYDNAVDCIKVLHGVFGISNKRIAGVMGISPSNLSLALKYGSFDMIVSKKRLELGVNSLRGLYIDRFFV